jgi:PAS domain S-box-containing protein
LRLAVSMSSKNDSAIHVLHVDDDLSILEVSKQILMEMGNFKIDTACCVEEALQKISTEHYDVVISDYEMPQKNGLQFLEELRRQNNQVPFILFTGKGKEEVVIKALNLGADRYQNKQGDPEIVYTELLVTIRQLFEKTKTKKMLWESEERFKNMVTNSKDLIMLTQADGIILYLSPACKEILGYEPSELIGKVPWIIHPDDLERVQKIFQSALTTELRGTAEYRILTKQGKTKWLNHSFSQIWENCKLKQIVSHLTDITESKKTQASLLESEERYRMIAENAQDIITVTDTQTRYIYVSPSMERLFGYDCNELIGKNAFEFFHPDDIPAIQSTFPALFRGGESPLIEFRFKTKDGLYIWLEGKAKGVKGKNDEVRVLVVSRNIEKRKKAELANALYEKNFRAYLESSPIAVFVANSSGKYEFVNDAACKLLAYSEEELLNMTVQDVVPKGDTPGRNFNQLKEHGYFAGEMKLTQKNNTLIDVFLSASKLPDGKLVAFCEDFTDRKKVEQSLMESHKKFQDLAETNGEFIWEMDSQGRYTYCSQQMEKLWGLKPAQMIGKTPFDAMPLADKEKAIANFIQNCNSPKSFNGLESTAYDSQGRLVFIETNGIPFFDNQGQLLGFRGISRDITERKKAEEQLKSSNQKIKTANEKLQVIGSLTRHDVGNKLSVISANTYLLKKSIGSNPELVRKLEAIDLAVFQSNKLFEFSCLYEKIGAEEPITIDVAESFGEATLLIHNPAIEIVNRCQGLTVKADTMLRQLFYNLIENSLKHGKTVTHIEIGYTENEQGTIIFYRDNGVGIAKENKEKIFSEGFTTGNGSGLGLKLVKKMVDVYGWSIQEVGMPGKGAQFNIIIPQTKKGSNYHRRTEIKLESNPALFSEPTQA